MLRRAVPPAETVAILQEIRSLSAAGYSRRQIGLKMGLSKSSITGYCVRNNIGYLVKPKRVSAKPGGDARAKSGPAIPDAYHMQPDPIEKWAALLAGQRYDDEPAAVAPEPVLRMLPAMSLTANSSMAWSG